MTTPCGMTTLELAAEMKQKLGNEPHKLLTPVLEDENMLNAMKISLAKIGEQLEVESQDSKELFGPMSFLQQQQPNGNRSASANKATLELAAEMKQKLGPGSERQKECSELHKLLALVLEDENMLNAVKISLAKPKALLEALDDMAVQCVDAEMKMPQEILVKNLAEVDTSQSVSDKKVQDCQTALDKCKETVQGAEMLAAEMKQTLESGIEDGSERQEECSDLHKLLAPVLEDENMFNDMKISLAKPKAQLEAFDDMAVQCVDAEMKQTQETLVITLAEVDTSQSVADKKVEDCQTALHKCKQTVQGAEIGVSTANGSVCNMERNNHCLPSAGGDFSNLVIATKLDGNLIDEFDLVRPARSVSSLAPPFPFMTFVPAMQDFAMQDFAMQDFELQ